MSTDYGSRAKALTTLAKASSEFPTLSLGRILTNALKSGEELRDLSDEELNARLTAYIEWENQLQEKYKEWVTSRRTKIPKTV